MEAGVVVLSLIGALVIGALIGLLYPPKQEQTAPVPVTIRVDDR